MIGPFWLFSFGKRYQRIRDIFEEEADEGPVGLKEEKKPEEDEFESQEKFHEEEASDGDEYDQESFE